MQPAVSASTAHGEYLLLELHVPGGPSLPAGVLLIDPREDRLHVQLRDSWPPAVAAEDGDVVHALAEDLAERARNEGAEAILGDLEASFSHTLRLTPRSSTLLHQPERQLAALFEKHVARSGERGISDALAIVPFRTHLPYYPIRIAAGVFDGDMEVEAGGWVPLPAGVRADPGHFVARITGQSMEPRVPDGSFCVFKANPQGSREGKLLLVQKHGASDSGGEFTIKRYHSEKTQAENTTVATGPEFLESGNEFDDPPEWRHSRVRLISLNPDFPSWDLEADQCKVIAEFIRVLGADEVPIELLGH